MRLGLVQIANELTDPEAGRELSLAAARDVFAAGAELVVLPELIASGYRLEREHQERSAEPLSGPTVRSWRELAREHNGYLVGGFTERDGEALFNAAVVVGPQGVLLHYRKLHLFRGERRIFCPGDLGLPVVSTPLGRIGVCICYDLRFVETLRILALQGAQLVCVPTAWVTGFDAQSWDASGMCPQARAALLQANLNQVFVACASQMGQVGDLTFLGSSVLGAPDGACLAGPFPADRPEVQVIDVDLDGAEAAQTRDGEIRPRDERRRDVYSVTVEGRTL